MASMKIPIIDDIFDDSPIRSSLRIPPLQDPSPAPSTKAGRPSPLEPEARVNISNEATELTGRRKALAQAVPLGAREPNDQEPMETQSIQEHPRKKQKVYAHKTITDFVQLPKPQRKVKEDKPRPFRPISVLNELHEPPPSAALFPPITPSASQEEQEDIRSNVRSVKTSKVKEHLPAKETKVKKSSSDANISKRVYLRQRTKWTEEETEQLVKGVAIYGMGRWKDILEHPEFTFQEGRTGMDLKDRFRVCFPPNAPHKWVRAMPEMQVEYNDTDDATKTKGKPQKVHRFPPRARKNLWTEAEDAELEKGFRLHGYQWNLIVKDPNLHLEGRTGGQVRDRFRLRFPELYNQQSSIPLQMRPLRIWTEEEDGALEKGFNLYGTQWSLMVKNPSLSLQGRSVGQIRDRFRSKFPEQYTQQSTSSRQNIPEKKARIPSQKSSDSSEQTEKDEASAKTTAPYTSTTITTTTTTTALLNGEEEDKRLSNSILHDGWDWDENLTLAPLAWEDMATRPMFPFE